MEYLKISRNRMFEATKKICSEVDRLFRILFYEEFKNEEIEINEEDKILVILKSRILLIAVHEKEYETIFKHLFPKAFDITSNQEYLRILPENVDKTIEESPETAEVFETLFPGQIKKYALINEPFTNIIQKVKRLSTGEVFAVGDKIKYYGRYSKIKSIYFNEHNQLSFEVEEDSPPLTGVFGASCPEKPKPILITDDNVNLYEGDGAWEVFLENYDMHYVSPDIIEWVKERSDRKLFSTKEAAKDYINLHKPKFSKKEIHQQFKAFEDDDRTTLLTCGFNYKDE